MYDCPDLLANKNNAGIKIIRMLIPANSHMSFHVNILINKTAINGNVIKPNIPPNSLTDIAFPLLVS